ncbi:hypothetical protein LTR66_004629 [Elasticomyces elasticus]|nr:hypothetical protein LTR66_004629 [Elasticomyces elasticus]
MVQQKQSSLPPKRTKNNKSKKHTRAPETVEEYQEAADFQESTGGKWRAGDPVKSCRAFLRAVEIYDAGLARFATDFDLAYNKARLQLEITQQQPALVVNLPVSLLEYLRQTLDSHRYVLQLNEEVPDALYNTAQVLTVLAEQLADGDNPGAKDEAIMFLRQALEYCSSCLSRQETLLEEQIKALQGSQSQDQLPAYTVDSMTGAFSGTELQLSASDSDSNYATVERAVAPSDLLDTSRAALSAMTTLISLASATDIATLSSMAKDIERKISTYQAILTIPDSEETRIEVALERTEFDAALAEAEFRFGTISTQTYLNRLHAFSTIPQESPTVLCSQAEALISFVVAVIQTQPRSQLAGTCWGPLTRAESLYSNAAALIQRSTSSSITSNNHDRARLFIAQGDLELLRVRVASSPNDISLTQNLPVLLEHAMKYYLGAVRFVSAPRVGITEEAEGKAVLVEIMQALQVGKEVSQTSTSARNKALRALRDLVGEEMVEREIADAIEKSFGGAKT